MKVPPIT